MQLQQLLSAALPDLPAMQVLSMEPASSSDHGAALPADEPTASPSKGMRVNSAMQNHLLLLRVPQTWLIHCPERSNLSIVGVIKLDISAPTLSTPALLHMPWSATAFTSLGITAWSVKC